MRGMHLGKTNLHLKIEIKILGEILPKSNKQSIGAMIKKIRPPFQENYTDDDGEVVEEVEDNQINLMGINDDETVFLTWKE